MRAASRLVLLLSLSARRTAGAQAPKDSSADQLLGHLVGDWTMTGDVRGHPVAYRLEARRTLGNRYVELHMIDQGHTASYEARVFIGVDTTGHGYIAHWIDNTGGSYSVPAGTGEAHGDTVFIVFPYTGNPFHDTFAYDPRTDSWHVALDAVNSTGARRHFAAYDVTRRKGGP